MDWLAQLVRSLPYDHNNNSLIPDSAEIGTFVRPSFPPMLTQFSILPGKVNEYQRLLGANLRWICVPSRGWQGTHPLNTTETRDKRRLHEPLAL